MAKFNKVEGAFKNIKTATGVSTTESMVNKFLNKEKEYGNMLGKIADAEKKILELKEEASVLGKEHSKLEGEEETLSINRREECDLSQEEKEFNELSERQKGDYLL